MKEITVRIGDVEHKAVRGESLMQWVDDTLTGEKRIVGAYANNYLTALNAALDEDVEVEWIHAGSEDGYRVLTRTTTLVFILALRKVMPGFRVDIEHFIGNGMYAAPQGKNSISYTQIDTIRQEMSAIIERDLRIKRETVSKEIAFSLLEKDRFQDKIELLSTLDRETVEVYMVDEHVFTFNGILAPSTGFAATFDVLSYYPGVMLMVPTPESGDKVPEFEEQAKLSKVFKGSKKWVDLLGIGYLGSINRFVRSGDMEYLIRVSEAYYENRISSIAQKIAEDDDINLILLSGPSSSGKTTTADRLSTQLGVYGKRPISISSDDYFLDREYTPVDEKGEKDFETIDAVDIKKLNEDLRILLEGGAVELPRFDFIQGRKVPSGRVVKLDERHPLIIEGIHSLNPRLTDGVPEKNKFKLYVSCLTQLNIDSHNRISTSDVRLLRRIIRDDRTRGYRPEATLAQWKKVREGEERNIFPYQENADEFLDSALIYEIHAMKNLAIEMLSQISPQSPYFRDATRLLELLKYFIAIEDTSPIPDYSILREFIG